MTAPVGKKRSPVKKTGEAKAVAKAPSRRKKTTSRARKSKAEETPAKVPTEPAEPKSRKESDRESFLEKGFLEFTVDNDLKIRLEKVHKLLGHDDVLTTMTEIVMAGLNITEGCSLLKQVREESEVDEEEFDHVFAQQFLGRA